MKKLLTILLLMHFIAMPVTLAAEATASTDVTAPKWEDYVPKKYQNPREFPRGKSIAELTVGIVLTDLILTAPIGIPMIVHSTTKLKNQGYYDKKIKFEKGLKEAEQIANAEERQAAYDALLKECKMKKKK